jgi:hypothetical protein
MIAVRTPSEGSEDLDQHSPAPHGEVDEAAAIATTG